MGKLKGKARFVNRRRRELRESATKAELILKEAMERAGFRFRFQSMIFCKRDNFACIMDFYFKTNGRQLCVEVDGGYHNTEKQRARDLYRDAAIKSKRGIDTLRITNHDVYTDTRGCLVKIANGLNISHLKSANAEACRKILNTNPCTTQ